MIADAIVAIPGDTPLPKLLAAIHQHRLGHVARVLSVSRAPIAAQLARAGVPMDSAPDFTVVDRVILVFAAALSDRGSRLLVERGAERCWLVSRAGNWREQTTITIAPPPQPQMRLPVANADEATASG